MLTRSTKLVAANSPTAFGIAVGCVAAAICIRLSLDAAIGIGATTPFITMFPAVLVSAVIGGLGPGLLAVVLSVVSTWFLFIGLPYSFSPLSTADVTSIVLYLLGALLVVIVATSMRRAVEHLETAQEKLFAALNASGTGTWRFDIQRDLLEWDEATVNVFGIDPNLAPRNAAEFFNLIHPADREQARRVVSDAVTYGTTAEHEFRTVLTDGSERWICDRARVIYDADKRPLYMIGAALDVTERKRSEERQMLLLNELNHRVKNTLATVQSLALQTLRNSSTLEVFQSNFMARLMALSATHDVLTNKLWENASISEILAAELQPYGGIDQKRIQADGEAVHLRPQQALPLGMAFHELATNAAKYGALSAPQGCIRISWSLVRAEPGKQHLEVQWREEGGPEVRRPEHKGFGTRLINRSIVHELGGAIEMSFAPAGVACCFRVPLNEA